MSAVVATNVVIARASARASRVSRLARAATAPRSIAPDNVALDRARLVRCRAEGEEKDTMSSLDAILGGSQDKDAPAEEPEPVKAPERKPGEVSEAMKKKLRDEYVGLGGTPSKPMPSNLFLNICLFISAIAIMAKLSGVLG